MVGIKDNTITLTPISKAIKGHTKLMEGANERFLIS